MKTKYLFLLIAYTFLYASATFAQSLVGVNQLTGSAGVTIPVYSFTRGQVTFPINLVYGGSGVRVRDVEGTAGIGWNLQAGGQVSRVLRGLPDDCTQDASGMNLFGWMNSSNTAIANISAISNNNNSCHFEEIDATNIPVNFPVTMDTEPDLFYVNAPGLSCELIYDRSASAFKPVNYQDLKITYAPSAGAITSFTIVNDKGITYVFSMPDRVGVKTSGSPSFFTTKYQQYVNGINYNDNWHLTSVKDANGNGITLGYATGQTRNSNDDVSLYLAGSTFATPQYTIAQSISPKILTGISSTDDDLITPEVAFTWRTSLQSAGGTDQNMIDSITARGKILQFNYSAVKYAIPGGGNYYRQFLRSFYEGSGNSPVYYLFSYYGETHVAPFNGNNYTTILPDSLSTKVDYWGYYAAANTSGSFLPKVWVNPSNASYQRYQLYQSSTGGTNYPYSIGATVPLNVDTSSSRTGSLKAITYPHSGKSIIAYESNDYYDPQTGLTNTAGGVRVTAIKDSAGEKTPAMYRYFSYKKPGSSSSSGKPITLPQYAITIPYGGGATGAALWTNATALSTNDLSEEDHTIMYEYCTESRPKGGVTVAQYYVPATNWDLTATPVCDGCTTAEWAPTLDMTARHDCSHYTYGPLSNYMLSYPFIPNPNYDFERGLVKKITSYLDDGTTKVSEAGYTYQRLFTPQSMYGFRYSDMTAASLTVTAYNKYLIYYNTGELGKSVTKTVYNTGSYSQPQTTSVTYTYGSANHKLLTQQDATNSDGSTVTTKISYTKDFAASSLATNANIKAIYNLNQLNINVPVESYQQVTKGTTKITSGSITLYNSFGSSGMMNLPAQQLKLVQPDGIASGSFTPFTISGSGATQAPSYNSNYFTTANYTAYDYSGYLLTADDGHHHVATSVTDHFNYRTLISVINAAANEFAFTNFDSESSATGFSPSPSGTPVSGGHSGKAYSIAASTALTSGIIHKSPLTTKYIFSVWINGTAGPNNLSISLNGGTATVYSCPATGSWKYYEIPLDVSAMTATFTIKVTNSAAITIDDVLFYPSVAGVSTFGYDPVTYAINTQTDTNGISTYFVNDIWGRVLQVLNQDHHIVQRNKYIIVDPTF